MKTRIAVALCALLVVAVASASEIKWAKSWDAAQAAAKSQNKLIMIDFYTDWCSWCKKLDKDTYTNAKVAAYSQKLIALKVDAEKEGEVLAVKYKVKGYPTILFVDAEGEIFGEIGGYMPPAEFLGEMTKIQELYASVPALQAKLKTNQNRGEAWARMAIVYAAQRKANLSRRAITLSDEAGYKGPYVAKAWNALGDYHQLSEKFDEAIACFNAAFASTKQNDDKSYAKMSIMYCQMSKGEMQKAREAAKELIAMPGATKEHIQLAKDLLKELGDGGQRGFGKR